MERKYYDLTAAQNILFFSQKYTIHKQVNNVCTSVLVDKELDLDRLKKAIEIAYDRNDALRIRIVKVDKSMKQYFEDKADSHIEFLDFTGKTQDQMEKKLYKIASKPVTVWGKPLSKTYMIRSYDGRSGLYFVVSHMIMDSWAITTFFKDVFGIYLSLEEGKDLPKPLKSFEKLLIEDLNYKNTKKYKVDREFWEKEFQKDQEPIYTSVNGYNVLEDFRKKKKDSNLRYLGTINLLRTKAKHAVLTFHKELVEKMEAYCLANRVSMQSLVLLAFRSYFSKVNRREKDIFFHTVIARRGTLAEKNTGGSRVYFMPFRTIFNEDETFKKACEIINEKQTTIYRHSSIDPLEVMSIWKGIYDLPQIGAYSGASVTFQPVKLVLPGQDIKIESKWYGNGAASQDLYLTVMDGDGTGSLKFYYEYLVHKVPLENIEKLHEYMIKAIEAGIANNEITIGELLSIE